MELQSHQYTYTYLDAPKIKIAIVDDHSLFRNGLWTMLNEYDRFELLFEASNGYELLEKLTVFTPDVIMLDIEMPEMNGIDATIVLKQKYPKIKILPLSMHDNEQYVIHLMQLGANGYLLKDSGVETVADAIISVVETGYYFNDYTSKAVLQQLVNNNTINPAFNSKALSPTEIEIVKLICCELSNEEIAKRLNSNPRLVRAYYKNILTKIGARNRAGIVLYAIKNRYFVP